MKRISNIVLLFAIMLINIMLFSSCLKNNKVTKKGLNGSYTIETITIAKGDKKIFGKLYLPLKKDRLNTVILSNDAKNDYKSMEEYAKSFANNNIASFIFDFVAGSDNCKSTGNIKTMSLDSGIDDLKDIVDYMITLDSIDKNNVFLFGEGQGGVISTNVAIKKQADIKGLMVLNPIWMLDMNIYDAMPSLNRDVLIIHGTKDETIPISYSEKALDAFKFVRLQKIQDATHEIKELYHLDEVERNMRDFITLNNILDDEIEYQEPLPGMDMNTLNFYEATFAILKKSAKMIYPSQYIKAHEYIGDQIETISLTAISVRETLSRQWGINDLETAMSVYNCLVKDGKENKSAWDLSRAMSNLYFYYNAGYIDFKTAMDLSYDAAKIIQSTFASWDEYNDSYLQGYSEWSKSTDRYEEYQELISGYRNNPFINTPFDVDLVPYEKIDDDNKNESNEGEISAL